MVGGATPSPPPDREPGAGRARAVLLLAASTVVFVVCVLVGAGGGPRGSDQFWYLADTETLLRGDPPTGNYLFPRQLLVQGIERSPFMHDILPQRAVMPLAHLIGPYGGWIAMNLLAMVAGAWLTFMAVRPLCDPLVAAAAAGALLLLPISVVGATQVLAEASMVPILATALLLALRPGGFLKYALLALVLTLAFMSRFTMIALLGLLPLLPFTEPAPMARRGLLALWCALLAAAGAAANRWIFGGIPLPGDPMTLAINGNGMDIWMTTEPIRITMDSVLAKLRLFVASLAEGSLATLVFSATNWALMIAAAIGAVAAWRRGARGPRVAALCTAAVLAVNLATLALYQNQPRFVLPTYPVLIAATALLLDGGGAWWRRTRGRLLPVMVAAMAPAAVAAAMIARGEGRRDAEARTKLEALAAALVGEGDLVHAYGNDQLLAYCLRPRTVLHLGQAQADSDWARVLAMARWRWVSAPEEALPRLRRLGVDGEVVATVERRGVRLAVVELRRGAATP